VKPQEEKGRFSNKALFLDRSMFDKRAGPGCARETGIAFF